MVDGHERERNEDIQDAFRRYLRRRGIKCTPARRKILDAVLGLSGHFEAEQILYFLRERGDKVGKATVYRTLPLLVDCGVIRQVRFDFKRAHYERDFQDEPHDHMICRRCGRIIEFNSEEVLKLRRAIAQRNRFHVIGHRFQLSGLCWECATACPVATMPPLRATASPAGRESGTATR